MVTDIALTAIKATQFLYIPMFLLEGGFLILFIALYDEKDSALSIAKAAYKTSKIFYVTTAIIFIAVLGFFIVTDSVEEHQAIYDAVVRNSLTTEFAMLIMQTISGRRILTLKGKMPPEEEKEDDE